MILSALDVTTVCHFYMFGDVEAADDDDSSGSKPPDLANKRKRFSAEEDMKLKLLVDGNRQKSWDQIASEMPGRTARQCRDRYNNYLFKEISGASWNPTEDEMIMRMYKEVGSKWSLIARHLNGRSGNNVKNRWYKYLSKHYDGSQNQKVFVVGGQQTEPEVDVESNTAFTPATVQYTSQLETYDLFTEDRIGSFVDDWDMPL